MKKVLIFLVLFFILASAALLSWNVSILPPSKDTTLSSFVIPKGASASQIGEKLQAQGLVKSSLAFKLYVQLTGKTREIKAGEYRLSPNLALPSIVAKLIKGPVGLWVTIPEGLRREEIAEKYIDTLEIKGADAGKFRNDFLRESQGHEGFLFPDTYLFPKEATASGIVAKMLSTFDKKVDSKIKDDIISSGLSLNQVVTLASILERETKTGEERPIVAGILLKRLKAGWPLQADASIQYIKAGANCQAVVGDCNWWPDLTKEDLKIVSSYNTYKFAGLPPGPIANPGLSSIKGATYPQDSPYWFYLHDVKGMIHYAKTIEEHNQNVQTYLAK